MKAISQLRRTFDNDKNPGGLFFRAKNPLWVSIVTRACIVSNCLYTIGEDTETEAVNFFVTGTREQLEACITVLESEVPA